jgi:hypothetical protein
MRRILSTFALDVKTEAVEFFVEALLKKKWRQVSGPFDNRKTAEAAAIKYSLENKCKTRVVAED